MDGSSITYNYDALSRMVKRDASGSSEYLMLYGLNDQPLSINNRDSSTSYLWTPDGTRLLGAVDNSGTEPEAHSVVTNGHSDLSLTIGADQSVTSSNIYRPYGEVQAHAGTLSLPLGYQSDYTDSATGLVDMGKRNYDPGLGTFTTPDPKAPEVTDSYSYNTYLYTNDAPIGRIDPTGEGWLGDLWNKATNFVKKAVQKVGDFISDCLHAASGVIHGKSIEEIKKEQRQREAAREAKLRKEAEKRKKKQAEKRRRSKENKERFEASTKGQAKEKSLWDRACDWVKEGAAALVSGIVQVAHKAKKGIDKLCKKAEKAIAAIGGYVTKAVKKVASAVVDTAKAVGRTLVKGVQAVGKAVVTGAKAVGRGIVAGAKAVGRGLAAISITKNAALNSSLIAPFGFIAESIIVLAAVCSVLLITYAILEYIVIPYYFNQMYSPMSDKAVKKTIKEMEEDKAEFYMMERKEFPDMFSPEEVQLARHAYNEKMILQKGQTITRRPVVLDDNSRRSHLNSYNYYRDWLVKEVEKDKPFHPKNPYNW